MKRGRRARQGGQSKGRHAGSSGHRLLSSFAQHAAPSRPKAHFPLCRMCNSVIVVIMNRGKKQVRHWLQQLQEPGLGRPPLPPARTRSKFLTF